MVMIQRIGMTGRSLYVVIPRAIAEAAALVRGDRVMVGLEQGRITFSKVDEAELLKLSRAARPETAGGRTRR